MKKFYLLISFVIVSISCSSDDEQHNISQNPHLLQRVDFYGGNSVYRYWLFNREGLLTEITKADGTLVEKFVYDTNNRLIQDTKYFNGAITETFNITYDSSDFITQVNDTAYDYSYYFHKYYYTSGNINYECLIDADFIMKESHKIFDDSVDQYYDNDYCNHDASRNMIGYSSSATFNGGPNCSYTYTDTTNPLRDATMSVLRAKSLYDPHFLADGLSSRNNKATLHYMAEDPESYVYRYELNSNNLPSQQFSDSYYQGIFENTSVSAKYYYQGDVLP